MTRRRARRAGALGVGVGVVVVVVDVVVVMVVCEVVKVAVESMQARGEQVVRVRLMGVEHPPLSHASLDNRRLDAVDSLTRPHEAPTGRSQLRRRKFERLLPILRLHGNAR